MISLYWGGRKIKNQKWNFVDELAEARDSDAAAAQEGI
jgi:hypothetical protein